jgi:formylglycine-generating enzyme required for sulfatase activity
MADIFISYSHKDQNYVQELTGYLKNKGFSVWVDERIDHGDRWWQTIVSNIRKCAAMVVVMTPDSEKTDWVEREYFFADKNKKPIFPLLLGGECFPFFVNRHYSDVRDRSMPPNALLGTLKQFVEQANEERNRKEEEQKRIEAARKAEEERKKKEAEAKRKADEEEQKRKEVKATKKPRTAESIKKSRLLKFGVLAVVIVILMVGIFWWGSQPPVKEIRQEIEKLNRQALNLENTISELDNQEQLKELFRQRDILSQQVAGFSEKATKFGLESQLEELHSFLKQIQIQLSHKEKELIAARKGKIFVESVPDNATVKILNIDQGFQQGMELEPGEYHIEVSLKDYEPQDRWIDLGAGEEKRVNFELTPPKVITNSLGMKFMLIPAGKFVMGSPPNEHWRDDDEKQHEVRISKPFYLQTTEVSQAQWEKVMGDNPSHFKDCGDDCPVESVSWNDAQKFISKLNKREGTNKYRLPTEAEWEYTCRAGTETAYSFDEVDKLGEYAWYEDNSEYQTHPVGEKKPNAWGLYDMHGNVLEWVQDWYGGYPTGPIPDPKGPDKGERRVLRGDSCSSVARGLRSANRYRYNPDSHYLLSGFRVARDF